MVRGHCIAITQPIQGSGNSIHGAEFDYRQGFTFLPGLLANTGMEFNFTYAPSKTGETDLAGNKIPFQDNSTESGNFILWYQEQAIPGPRRVQLPLETSLRGEMWAASSGLEEYEAPQKYLDASVAYKVQQVRRTVCERHQPHQRVPAVLPRMARPARALELLRTHVHGRRPRAVVIGVLGAAVTRTRRPGTPSVRVVAALAALAGTSLACADSIFAPRGWMAEAGSATAIAHWQIQSSAKAQQSGAEVSSAGYSTTRAGTR